LTTDLLFGDRSIEGANHRRSTFGFHGCLHEELSLRPWVLQTAQKWPEIAGSKSGVFAKLGE